MKEKEKHFIDDSEEFEDEWSEVEIKFNLSICLLCLGVQLCLFRNIRMLRRCWLSLRNRLKREGTGTTICSLLASWSRGSRKGLSTWTLLSRITGSANYGLASSYPRRTFPSPWHFPTPSCSLQSCCQSSITISSKSSASTSHR